MSVDPKVIAKIKARLAAAETSGLGGDYKAINDKAVEGTKPTNALGKYQFVPSIWWNPIKKFAKENGYPQMKEYGDFLNSPNLQEEFFDFYVTDTVIPKAQELMQYNERNLTFDEIAQLTHMNNNGKSVKKFLQMGVFDIANAENNMGAEKYLAKGKLGLVNEGLGPVTPAELMSEEKVKKNVDGFFSEREAILKKFDSGKISEGAKNSLMDNLKTTYGQKGVVNKINLEAVRKNTEIDAAFNDERAKVAELYNELSDGNDKNIRREYDPKTGRLTIKGANNYGRLKIEEYIKASGGKLREDRGNVEAKESYNADTGTYIKTAEAQKNVGLKSITFNFKEKGGNADYLVKGINKYGTSEDNINHEGLAADLGLRQKDGGYVNNNPGPQLTKKIEFSKTVDPKELIGLIDKEYDRLPEKKAEEVKPTEDKKGDTKTEEKPVEKTVEKPTAEVTQINNAGLYQELDAQDTTVYDANKFKREVPYDAIIQGMMGIQGLAAADNEIPMRTEEISAGMQDYISKMQELSNIGLPPELEAKAKDSLANAAQLGMNNIVRSSNGNRNLVLGNSSQIDLARMKGEVDLSVADFQMKVDAMNQYGEAMKYVNEFKTNKDIANTQVKQRIAIQDRQAAGELAGTAFDGMIKSIQNQKERAPGTPYHMLMSKHAMDAFGFDPNMEDDGKGTTVGTKSYFLGQKDKINANNQRVQNIDANIATFGEDKVKAYNQLSENFGYNPRKASDLSDFIKNNDVSSMNFNNAQAALKDNNYDLLLRPDSSPQTIDANTYGIDQGVLDKNQNASQEINNYATYLK